MSEQTHIEELKRVFSELAGHDLDAADPNIPFLDLGLDSLFLTQASAAIRNRFGVKVSFRQLFEQFPSFTTLGQHLAKTSTLSLIPPVPPSPAAPVTAAITSLPLAIESPAVSVTSERLTGTTLERVINAQMRVMEQQLALLRQSTHRVNDVKPVTATPTVKPIEPGASTAKPAEPTESIQHGPFRPLERVDPGVLTPAQAQHVSWLCQRYLNRTRRSRDYTEKYRPRLADPRAVAGFKLSWKEIVYPIVSCRSEGAYLWDLDGNRWLDVTMGFGVALLGHSPKFVTEAVKAQLDLGVEIGPQSPLAGEVAQLISELTGHERITFCNTGSEAVMAAIRICRTVTGRTRIALFSGAYHGTFDEVLVKGTTVGGEPKALPLAPGVACNLVSEVTVLEYGSARALDWFREHSAELAAVLVEPVQSRHPGLQPKEFLGEVRRITQATETPLIFDEVITGFRCHPGGAQAWFGIRADLATYGKIVGGGMPFGFIAGRPELMDALDGGVWQYGDQSFPPAGVTFFAGTFVRHPLALAAAKVMLLHLKERGPALQESLAARTSAMCAELNRYFKEFSIPIDLESFTSVWYPRFASTVKFGSLLYFHLREKGLHIWEGRPCFLSTAHNDADVQFIVRAFKLSVAEMQAGGFLSGTSAPEWIQEAREQGAGGRPDSTDSTPGAAIAFPGSAGVKTMASSPERIPLSFAQSEVWIASQLGPKASCAFNESCALRLTGPLNVDALQRSLQVVVDRHESLRATFASDGSGQYFQATLRVTPRFIDLSPEPREVQTSRLRELRSAEGRRVFDLEQGPVFAFQLIRLAEQEHWLTFTAHHIACDGWSYDIILTELGRFYSAYARGLETQLPPATSYREYVMWERERQRTQEGKQALAYWCGLFETVPVPMELPVDRLRPTRRTFGGARVTRQLPAHLLPKLRRAGAEHRATLFSTLYSAFAILIHRLCGQEEMAVGILAAGQGVIGKDDLVGHCANLLPVRLRLDAEMPLSTCITQVQRSVLDAFEHQDISFGTVLDRVAVPRQAGHVPLTCVVFNLDPPLSKIRFADLAHQIELNPRHCYQFDLGFNLVESEGVLTVECDYNTDLFEAETTRRWLAHYESILTAMTNQSASSIGSLPLEADDPASGAPLSGPDDLPIPPGIETIHAWFDRQTVATPTAIAAGCEERTITYAELNARANRLARFLQQNGAGPEVLVGICLERSLDMLVAVLGVLKSGAAYVPLDPTFPADRLAMMAEDSGMRVVVSQQSLLGFIPAERLRWIGVDNDAEVINRQSAENLSPLASGANAAYVIYTSGSTGKPKGVVVEHRNVVNFLASMQREPGITSTDVMLALTTLSFDIAGLELFLPLVTGARVEIVSRRVAADPFELATAMEKAGVTVAQATPATWRALIETNWQGHSRLKILCGGEAFGTDLAEKLIERSGEAWNMYGPTETTIWSTVSRLERGQPVVLGRPIGKTQLWVVDKQMRPCPPGVSGELMIGGAGVARGYHQRPELTAERFVSLTGAERVYRTGDLVRRGFHSTLEFLGRMDHQVKLRGYRIELGEVESALQRLPQVREAVVTVREDIPGKPILAAYIVPRHRVSLELWPASPSAGGQQHYDDTLYDLMAGDEHRIARFLEAFHRTVRGKSVLDVGTGRDAILARLALEAGAQHVYAVELLEEPCRQAKELVARLKLADRITVIQGDAAQVDLPARVDVCVAEITGHIGGAEGLETLLKGLSRRHLKTGGTIIPARVQTKVAALELDPEFVANPRFSALARPYVENLFKVAGGPYDLRLSLKGATPRNLRSTIGVFEDCDLIRGSEPAYELDLDLEIKENSTIDGLLLWLEIQLAPGVEFDGLAVQDSWLPVYLPAFDPPLPVSAGDHIRARVTGRLSANSLNKDYAVCGHVERQQAENFEFRFDSRHNSGGYRQNGFYQRLFRDDLIPVADASMSRPDARALRRTLQASLPPYMVPSAFVTLEALPLTPNGKVDRKALPKVHTTTGAHDPTPFEEPITPVEKTLASIWASLLNVPRVGRGDDFFDLGGTSLLAVSLFARIEREFGQRLPLITLFEASTLQKLARQIRGLSSRPIAHVALTPIHADGPASPLFLVHGAAGNILLYRALAQRLASTCPVYGFQARGLEDAEGPCHHIEEMAEHYVEELREFQPHGPYRLGGYCMGGTVAFHMARLLREAGESVTLLALLDTYNLALVGPPDSLAQRVAVLRQKLSFHWSNLRALEGGERSSYVREKWRAIKETSKAKVTSLVRDLKARATADELKPDAGLTLEQVHDVAAYAYRPQAIDGSMVIFKTRLNYDIYPDPNLGWGELVHGKLDLVELPVNPHAMLVEPYVEQLAMRLKAYLKNPEPR